jgi:hypothetical protein
MGPPGSLGRSICLRFEVVGGAGVTADPKSNEAAIIAAVLWLEVSFATRLGQDPRRWPESLNAIRWSAPSVFDPSSPHYSPADRFDAETRRLWGLLWDAARRKCRQAPGLPAAVLDADDPAARSAARVVPPGAKTVWLGKQGKVIAGYLFDSREAKAKAKFNFRQRRLREFEMIIRNRYGGRAVDTDDHVEEFIELVANHALDPEQTRGWCRTWTPRAPAQLVEDAIAAATRKPRLYRADKVATMLGVSYAERQWLGLRTIGAVDVSKAERAQLREERKRLAKAKKRREAGATPRSDSKAAQARALGISVSALRRRLKKKVG